MKLRLSPPLVMFLLALPGMSLVCSSHGADVLNIPDSYTKTSVSISADFGSSYDATGQGLYGFVLQNSQSLMGSSCLWWHQRGNFLYGREMILTAEGAFAGQFDLTITGHQGEGSVFCLDTRNATFRAPSILKIGGLNNVSVANMHKTVGIGGSTFLRGEGAVIWARATTNNNQIFSSSVSVSGNAGSISWVNNGVSLATTTGANYYLQVRGGVVMVGENSSVDMSRNAGGVLFEDNFVEGDSRIITPGSSPATDHGRGVCMAQGGAVYGQYAMQLSLSDNGGAVVFRGNYASALGTLDPTLSNPRAEAFGGAICGSSSPTITLSKNGGGVLFEANYALAVGQETGIASSNTRALGGAICSEAGGTINLADNVGGVVFRSNYVATNSTRAGSALGGAIYHNKGGTLSIHGNDHVEFRGNYEKPGNGAAVRLRSIYLEAASSNTYLYLSAPEGGDIVFYDSVYVGENSRPYINAYFDSVDAAWHYSSGDVVFTGETIEEDLKRVTGKASVTEEEVRINSTSEFLIDGPVNVCGGRLIVRDGANIKGGEYTFFNVGFEKGTSEAALSPSSVLMLQQGAVSADEIIINGTGTLSSVGTGNKLTMKHSLTMESGATLEFRLTPGMLSSSALLLEGSLSISSGADLNVRLLAVPGEALKVGGTYGLMTMTGTVPNDKKWNADHITVSGLSDSFSSLYWGGADGKTLFFVYTPAVDVLWDGDGTTIGMKWDKENSNWLTEEEAIDYTYKNGVRATFGDIGAGSIDLVEDLYPREVIVRNGAGHDYVFTGAGSITGSSTLLKEGAGSLTLATTNSYDGGTSLREGALVVSATNALGTGGVAISGVSGERSLVFRGEGLTQSGNVEVEAGSSATLKVEGGHVVLGGRVINGGKLRIQGELKASSFFLDQTSLTTLEDGVFLRGNISASSHSVTEINGFVKFEGGYSVQGDSTSSHMIIINMNDAMMQATDSHPVWQFVEGGMSAPVGALGFIMEFDRPLENSVLPIVHIYAASSSVDTQKTLDASRVRLIDLDGWYADVTDDVFLFLSGQRKPGPDKPNVVVSAPEGVGAGESNSMWTTTRSLWSFADNMRNRSGYALSKEGKASFWVTSLGDFFNQDGQMSAPGYRFNSWGYAAGADYRLSDTWLTGFAFGQTFGKQDVSGGVGAVDQDAMMAAFKMNKVFRLDDINEISLNFVGAYGGTDNEGTVMSPTLLGDVQRGKWNDNAWMADLKAAWSHQFTEHLSCVIYSGIQYTSLRQESHDSAGNRFSYRMSSDSLTSLRLPVGVEFVREGNLLGLKAAGYARTGIVQDLKGERPSIGVSTDTRSWQVRGNTPGRTAYTCGIGGRIYVSDGWSLAADYSLETSSRTVNQTGNVSAMYEF